MALLTCLLLTQASCREGQTPAALAEAPAAAPAPTKPVPPVPAGHPRVYVRPGDLPAIREKIATEEFRPLWEQVRAGVDDRQMGPFCAAFVYLVAGEREMGRAAIEGCLAMLRRADDARTVGMVPDWAPCVFDWCYDLLTPEEKQAYVREFIRIFSAHEPGYPARLDSHSVVGHGTEGWLLTGQLPAGVAICDEEPAMYRAAAALFFERFVEARNFYYPGHAHHQGDSYSSRFLHDQLASWLFRRMGAGDVLSREQQYVPYQMIYCLRPDGQQIRSGDTYDDPGRSNSKRLIALLTGCYYDDPYLMTLADSDLFSRTNAFMRVFEILFRKPNAPKRPLSELPRTHYFAEPIGEMVARTGWTLGADSPDAVVQMRIGQYFFGNHQRKDFGTFQVYHRGALAIASGVYEGTGSGYGTEHWSDYYHQTIAHNGLLVFDPNEEMRQGGRRRANDGGQRWPNQGADHPPTLEVMKAQGYQMGEVTAHAAGPDLKAPEYSLIAGDITRAYTEKVRRVTRAMVTLDTGDATYPCVLVVFDRVVAADPSFKKTWLLHSMQEPRVQGRSITLVRDEAPYHGKLVAESLLPAGASIATVGGPGKEFWVEAAGKNYATQKRNSEAGAWRVEVSPAPGSAEDLFLHVLTVMDAGVPAGPAVTKVEGEGVVGARVLGRTVLFSRDGAPLERASFRSERGERILVVGLRPGSWAVLRKGTDLGVAFPVTAEAKSLWIEPLPGEWELHWSPD